MIRIAKSATIAIALLTLAVASAVFAADANTPVKIDTAKIVDLTYTFDASTIYWPDEKGFVHRLEKNGDTPEHYFYAAAITRRPSMAGRIPTRRIISIATGSRSTRFRSPIVSGRPR